MSSCACDACQFELSAAEARSREKLCPFCRERCFPSATFNGKPTRLTLKHEARIQIHASFDEQARRERERGEEFRARQHQVIGEFVDTMKPHVKAGVDILMQKLLKKIGG